MDKLNFVKNGITRLPPGFRFHPTDEELVVHYLARKVHSLPLFIPIPEADVSTSDPWSTPGDPEKERYLFSTIEIKYPNGKRSNRATPSGFWKATGLDKKIVDSRTKQVVGTKKTLVFYSGKPPNGSKTSWIMHEYKLVNPPQGVENWVICRMFLKKRGRKDEDRVSIERTGPIFHNFIPGQPRKFDLNLNLNLNLEGPSSSSSGSSGVTIGDEIEEKSN